MEVVEQKALATGVVVILSLVFGFLPLLIARRFDLSNIETLDPEVIRREKKKFKNVALSFLLNLGGGVLLANCFCHWLPEVREGLDHTDIDTFLPLAEVIMCSGFFFICGLEEVLHHFLHPHQQPKQQDIKLNTVSSQTGNVKDHTEDTEVLADKKAQRTAGEIKAAIRTVFVVLALSFHSVVEGLALSLEEDTAGVWLNTGATALHKFVISFSVGVELVSNKVSLLMYSVSIVIFSFAPALGSSVGILLTETNFPPSKIDLPLQILQGIATGTIVYVVFFEIFPKAKVVGGTGKQHVLAMVLGFAIFLPSLYFHHTMEEEDEDNPNCGNSTEVFMS